MGFMFLKLHAATITKPNDVSTTHVYHKMANSTYLPYTRKCQDSF